MTSNHPGPEQAPGNAPLFQADAYRSVLDKLPDALQIWSPEGRLLYANPATYRLFGLPTDTRIQDCTNLLCHCLDETGNPLGRSTESVAALMAAGTGETGKVYRVLLGDSQQRWLRLRTYEQTLTWDDAPAACLVSIATDLTHFMEREEALRKQAQYDTLTGLPNRVLFADRLQQAVATAQRRHELLAVCLLDLDGFKPINDTWGHKAGDRVLQEIAYRLESRLRADDTATRIGGDEFALLIGGLHGPAECEQVLNRLLHDIACPISVGEQAVTVTASIGVSLFPGDVKDPDQLLRHADQAMYKAKEAGKGRFHIFDPAVANKLRASQDLMRRIQEALDAGQFRLYYQPKVDCRLGKVVGFEALIRWQHPILGLRTPGEFLPLIEQEDAIIGLGEWVIAEALSQIERWQNEGLDLPVSVNIASRQFLRGNFAVRFGELLSKHPPERIRLLGIEIVETAVLEDINQVSRVIHHYRKEGVKFDLDDFGTGYSSLIHLKRLAADTLKIDQGFVRDMLDDPGDLTIVQGVINLSKAFHLGVVAEGVEDIEHILTLLDLGCDVMQGYGLARPMPADRVADWTRHFIPDPRWKAVGNSFPHRGDFDLLLAKVIYRYWHQRVVAAANGPQGKTTWPELDVQQCRLTRWHVESGVRQFGGGPEFLRFDQIHREAHRLAVLLKEATDLALPSRETLLTEFNEAGNRLLKTLESCKQDS